MSENLCPELETLVLGVAGGDEKLQAHARSCPSCAAALEEHRQLEKDLFRLVDPLPPPDFTRMVMARVAAAPAPLGREVKAGGGILVVSLALFVGFLVRGGTTWAGAGVGFARALLELRTVAVALGNGLTALWSTAAIPLVAISYLVLATTLFGLKRLAGSTQSA